MARDPADKSLAKSHAGLVHRVLIQTLSRTEFQRVGIPEQVD